MRLQPLVLMLTLLAGCASTQSDPLKATRPYPRELKQESVVQIQVIPGPTTIDIVNATARSYRDFDLWLNQRYVTHIEALEAGRTLTVPIGSFWDWRGEAPFEGGIFRYYAPTPIVLLQMQLDETSPLIGMKPVLPEGARDFYENPSPVPSKRPRK